MNIPLVSPFLEWLFELISSFVGSYGWAIIIMTVLIKLAIMPLDLKQRRSMARMAELQPQIEKINQKYKNDENKKNEKTLELYKEYKVSPMGGCLPMLLSMLVLFGLFGALRNVGGKHAIEMLETLKEGGEYIPQGWLWIKNVWQADNFFNMQEMMQAIGGLFNGKLFAGEIAWTGMSVIPDNQSMSTLGTKAVMEQIKVLLEDKTVITALEALRAQYAGQVNGYFILPVLATLSQVLATSITNKQQKSAGAANSQAASMNKFMTYFFPIMTLWICASYNSVFTIYWVVSNLWSIGQTVILNLVDKRKKAEAAAKED